VSFSASAQKETYKQKPGFEAVVEIEAAVEGILDIKCCCRGRGCNVLRPLSKCRGCCRLSRFEVEVEAVEVEAPSIDHSYTDLLAAAALFFVVVRAEKSVDLRKTEGNKEIFLSFYLREKLL
jgi:hypothetical protein